MYTVEVAYLFGNEQLQALTKLVNVKEYLKYIVLH